MTYKKTEPFEGSSFPLRVTVQKQKKILVNPHWHEHLEMMLVLAGRVRMQLSGKVYEGEAGDIFFVNSNVLHGVEALEAGAELLGVVWDIHLITSLMEEVELQHLYHLLIRSEVHPVLARARQPEWDAYGGALLEVRREYESRGLGYRTAIKFGVFQLVREQLRKLPGAEDLMKITQDYERLKPAIECIEQGYSGKLLLEEVAGAAGLSLFHFCRLFKRVMNRTVQQFVQEVRLREARRLLRDTDLPMAELSERVGYCNPNYFARVFREHTGTTPLRMRKQFQDMNAAGQQPHE
ncbi:AraC family transcriptional regulator [Paenibacillus sp. YN15]|uniref:AraC family transcriptional regulator n=1 Tax=Paenibacillus sp. YN15 TaxID=1742774 RepID=UPI0015ECD42A|nr:AraC family transcriptional regulator [Paenibacillus sp. YN15]